MSKAAYSPNKAAWHLDRIGEMRAGRQARPINLQLIISDLCNHDCFFCAYRAETGISVQRFSEWEGDKRIHNPSRMIPTDKVREILSDAAALGVKSITFTGGGEPTVHPEHMELFREALDLGFDCSLNTNGALLREGWEEVLPRFKYIRVSVDAANAKEYAEIRRVPETTYGKVMANVSELARACGTECVVGVGYVVTPGNYENVIDGVRAIKGTGVRYVRLASMQSTEQEEPYGHRFHLASDACRRAEEKVNGDGFVVVNLFDQAMGQPSTGHFCGFQQLVLYIGGDQNIYRCCYTAYNDLGLIGSLKAQTLDQWFHSAEKEKAIAEFDAMQCGICPLDGKNETIRYMTCGEPLHVNFI